MTAHSRLMFSRSFLVYSASYNPVTYEVTIHKNTYLCKGLRCFCFWTELATPALNLMHGAPPLGNICAFHVDCLNVEFPLLFASLFHISVAQTDENMLPWAHTQTHKRFHSHTEHSFLALSLPSTSPIIPCHRKTTQKDGQESISPIQFKHIESHMTENGYHSRQYFRPPLLCGCIVQTKEGVSSI